MIDPQLDGRVVLITGANHGIGAAAARAFALQGAQVYITYYRAPPGYSAQELEEAHKAGIGGDRLYQALQQQPAAPLVEEIRAEGGIATAHEADLADPGNIPRLFDGCEAELGPVDVTPP
jgi:3-oxoacyl-[acyl-carrier protein] reductase